MLPPDVSRQFSGVIFKVPKSIRSLERRDTTSDAASHPERTGTSPTPAAKNLKISLNFISYLSKLCASKCTRPIQ